MSIAAMPELSHESLSPDFEEIYRLYSPMIYRTARAVMGSSEDAEDVLQSIFLKLIRLELSSQLRKNPKAYLYRMAVNASLDMLRARRLRTFTHDVEQLKTFPTDGQKRFDEELHLRLNAALAGLSPESVQILVLRYVHDYSDAEISKLLGTSRGAIALRLFRVRARLKKVLNEKR